MIIQPPEQRIDADALKAWRLTGSISAAVYAIVVIGLVWLTVRFDWPAWIVVTAAALAVGGSYLEAFLLPSMRWKRFRYDIHEQEIDLLYGLLIKKRVLIPMVKVQHVDTKQGPILRRYGLATVTFSTAAGSHFIPALRESTAESVRSQIARLARITDEEL
jgi:uncharacterized protein